MALQQLDPERRPEALDLGKAAFDDKLAEPFLTTTITVTRQ